MNTKARVGGVARPRSSRATGLSYLAGVIAVAILSACATNRDHLMTTISYGTEAEATQYVRTHDIDDIDGVPPQRYRPGLFGGSMCNHHTPLLSAVERGLGEVVKALLDKGASPNAANAQGTTPLMIAAREGYDSILKLLLERGADVKAREHDGDDALMASVCPADRGRDTDREAALKRKILELLVNPANPVLAALAEELARAYELEITRDSQGAPRFDLDQVAGFAAATTNLLLKHGAAPDTRNDKGESALLRAIKCRQGLHALLLLRRGADINAADNKGETPLLVAIEWHMPEMAAFLLEEGADVSRYDKKGYSPLRASLAQIDDVCCRRCANRQNHPRGKTVGFDPAQCRKAVSLVKAIYRKGAEDREGRGLLWATHAPCQDYDIPSADVYEIARLSVLGGADPNAKSDFFGTPAMFSFVHSHAKHVCPRLADRSQDLAMVELLLTRGADVNATYPGRDSYYRPDESILHFALRESDWKVALLLLRKGAEVKAEDFGKLAPASVIRQQRMCAERKDAECDEFRQVIELATRERKD